MRRIALTLFLILSCLASPGQVRVIFVNGHIGMGSPKGGEAYWMKDSTFVDSTLAALNSTAGPYFTDVQYPVLSSASGRMEKGYAYAEDRLDSIVSGCSGPFRIVTHSMGAAFGEGIARCLLDRGFKVDMIVHFEPYQASAIESVGAAKDVYVIDYQMTDDWLIHLGGKGRIKGADFLLGNRPSDAPPKKKHRYPINHSSTWTEIRPYVALLEGEDAGKHEN